MRLFGLVISALLLSTATYATYDIHELLEDSIARNNLEGDRECRGMKKFIQVFFLDGDFTDTQLTFLESSNGSMTRVFKPAKNFSICTDDGLTYMLVEDDSKTFEENGVIVIGGNYQVYDVRTSSNLNKYGYTDENIDLPLIAFTPSPTSNPSVAPSAAPTDACIKPDVQLRISFDPENDPGDNHWTLFKFDSEGNPTVLYEENGPIFHDYISCLEPGCYGFNAVDCGDDGLSDNGTYTIFINNEPLKTKQTFERAEPAKWCVMDTTCRGNEIFFQVEINADLNAQNETNWELVRLGTGFQEKVFEFIGSYDVCLPAGHYVWDIHDSAGNGLCCDNGLGGYTVKINGEIVQTGSDFGTWDYFDFYTSDYN